MAYGTLRTTLSVTFLAGIGACLLPACGQGSFEGTPTGNPPPGGETTGGADGAGAQGTGGSGNGSESGGTTGSGGSQSSSGGTTGSVDQPPPLTSGCDGWGTRYWDCCKPHCSWKGNTDDAGVTPARMCGSNNQVLSVSEPEPQSACSGGQAHVCYNNAPWAVSPTLSYGFAATAPGDVCGRCYQLQFKGSSHNAGNDHGAQALQGKTMIVQATNIGHDVNFESSQIDLMIPGGGVGMFDACSNQWNVHGQLGEQHGGFLMSCKMQHGWDASHSVLKTCVRNWCNDVFGSNPSLAEMLTACEWFVDWFEVADNPNFLYREVECPQALIERTGMDRRPRNDIQNNCGG